MYKISESQIDYILDDIRARGIEMEDLQYNLLDHVCCIIEQNLKEGESFEDFYLKTIRRFYRKALWEIEEETLTLLTFKHYYAMKKVMIWSGIIGTSILLIGNVFKFLHWPGANASIIFGIGILALFFLPLMFTLKVKEKSEIRDKLILVLGMVISFMVCMSFLFKLMHWPGANILGTSSIIGIIFVFAPIYLITGIRNPANKINTIVTTILLVGGAGMLYSLTAVKVSKTMNEAIWDLAMDNEKQLRVFEKSCLDFLKKDSVHRQNLNAIQLIVRQSDALKKKMVAYCFPTDTNVSFDNLREVGGFELGSFSILPAGEPSPELIEFQNSIQKFYGLSGGYQLDNEWARKNFTGLTYPGIIIRLNDIEREVLLAAMR